jgi:hypothetical protein
VGNPAIHPDDAKREIPLNVAQHEHRAGMTSPAPVNTCDQTLARNSRNVAELAGKRLLAAARFDFFARNYVIAQAYRQS